MIFLVVALFYPQVNFCFGGGVGSNRSVGYLGT